MFPVITSGVLLQSASTWLHSQGRISGFCWMTLIGLFVPGVCRMGPCCSIG